MDGWSGGRFARELTQNSFSELPVTIPHALAVHALPLHHRDPFDRMLIAQALFEQLTIVTADPEFARYDVTILRADV
ncbi:MAG: type II toxin-antitoxin system VapC family toxin [Bacteroidales bacterium]